MFLVFHCECPGLKIINDHNAVLVLSLQEPPLKRKIPRLFLWCIVEVLRVVMLVVACGFTDVQ